MPVRGPAGLLGDRRGAAALEFALILGAVVLLLLGTVQVGMALRQRAEVSYALGQAVRLIHVDPTVSGEALEAAVAAALEGRGPTEFAVTIEATAAARVLKVAVSFPFRVVLPFVEIGTLDMRVETLTPAVMPAS